MISMDYLFLSDKGVFTRRELADSDVVESSVLKILVVFDSATQVLLTYAVPRKGAGEYVVEAVSNGVAWLGHARVIVTADGELCFLRPCGSSK